MALLRVRSRVGRPVAGPRLLPDTVTAEKVAARAAELRLRVEAAYALLTMHRLSPERLSADRALALVREVLLGNIIPWRADVSALSVERRIAALTARNARLERDNTNLRATVADLRKRARKRPLIGYREPPPVLPAAALTDRERHVLDGMSRGRTNRQIGEDLRISVDTVKVHAATLFRKLGASDRAHAVALGFRTGLLA